MTKKALVALAQCASYGEALQPAVEALVDSLGGLGRFVKPGQSVLLKPNLLTGCAPEQGVTTHPEVVRALIRMLRQHGAEPSVGDSPNNVMKMEDVWDKSGFRAMCDRENVPLVNIEQSGAELFTVNGITFTVARAALEADVVINVPKVKTHVLTTLTAAVKNTYGLVPGFQKAKLHKLYPSARRFGEVVAAVYAKTRPALSVADAVEGMEGDGPSGGSKKALGFLAASADAAALDAVLCDILGIDPLTVPYFTPIRDAGTGETELAKIEVSGAPANSLKPASFAVPTTLRARLIPVWLVRLLAPFLWIRPSFLDRCVRCDRCVKACPVQALRREGDDKPVLDAAKCIGCCCCHEVCPAKAIHMQFSPLLALAQRLRAP